jgi:hypothetical protein
MAQDLPAARGVIISHETVRRWAEKFGWTSATKSTAARRVTGAGSRGLAFLILVRVTGEEYLRYSPPPY